MNMSFNFKNFSSIIIFFVLTISFLFLLCLPVKAVDSRVTGKIYVKIDNEKIPIPGLIVVREDNGGNNFWGSNKGVYSVTLSRNQSSERVGMYGFMDYAWGATPANCGDSSACPSLIIGQSANQSTCSLTYRCGINCHGWEVRWLAYFPPGFNPANLPAGIYFNPTDMKGGGSFRVLTDTGDMGDLLSVRPGGTNWKVNAINFGEVTYGPNEWYRGSVNNNASFHADADIEWIPGENPLRCLSLTPQPQNPQPGQTLQFTCRAPSQIKQIVNHYNFRVNEGASTYVPAPHEHPDYATFSYTVPQEGGEYKVQCQVCASSDNSKCTAWGQAQ